MNLRASTWAVIVGLSLAGPAALRAMTFHGTVEIPKGAAPADFTVCLEHHDGRDQTPPSTFLLEQPLVEGGAFHFAVPDTAKESYALFVRNAAGQVLVGYPHLSRSRNFGSIPLKLDAEASGLLIAPDGKPLPDTTVRLERKLEANCSHYLDAGETKTDATGAFLFGDLNHGHYRLSVQSDRYTHLDHEIVLAGDLNYSEIRLTKAASISGRVLLPGGKPAPGVSVRADSRPPVTTDAEGRYRITGLGPDSYNLVASTDTLAAEGNIRTRVQLKNSDVTAPDIVVAPVGSLRLTLKPEPAGRPLPKTITISLWAKNRNSSWSSEYSAPVTNGTALFSKLPAGLYQVRLSDQAMGEAQSEVTIASGSESAASVVLPEVFSLGGRVESSDGKPLPEARLMIQAPRGRMGSGFYRHAQSGDDGTFTVTGLPRGDIVLTIQSENRAPLTEKMTMTGDVTGRLFKVIDGMTVSGRLVDAAGGPVADAAIKLEPVRSSGDFMTYSYNSSTLKSGTDGSFVIKGVSEGSYKVDVEAEAYYDDFKPIQIAGSTNLGNLTLQKGLVISGTVSDADGKPAAGSNIHVSGAPSNKKQMGRYISKRIETKDDGSFEAAGLPEGRYTVSIMDGDSYQEVLSLEDIEAGTEGLIVSLARLVQLKVRVMGPDGKPVEGAVIGIGKVSDRSTRFTGVDDRKTGADGVCPIDVREGARYEITAAKAPLLDARAKLDLTGQAKPPAEVVLTMEPGLVLAGLVVDPDGKPKADVYVSVGVLVPVKTDTQGRFKLEGVRPGSADILVYADEERETPLASQRLVLARDKPAADLRIELGRTGILRGTVKDKEGAPAADAMVMLHNPKERGRGQSYQGKTAADGTYLFDRVVPGSYMVMSVVMNERDNRMPQMRMIEVKAGETATADFPLASKAAGKLTGTVTLAGKPLPDVHVFLIPLQSDDSADGMGLLMSMGREPAKTDANGRFETEGREPGRHLVRIGTRGQPFGDDEENALQYTSEIQIGKGQTNLAIDVTGTTIRGVVKDAAGAPVAKAKVTLQPLGASMETIAFQMRQMETDDQGRFEAKYMPNAPLRVMASDAAEENIAQLDLKPNDGTAVPVITLQPGIRISGKVTPVKEDDDSPTLLIVFTEDGLPIRFDPADEEGTYEVTPPLAPGKYTLVCVQEGMGAETLSLDLKQTMTQDFALQPGGDIQVELRGDDKRIAGRALQIVNSKGITLFRLKSAGTMGGLGGMMDCVTLAPTDKTGKTLVKGLPPGDYAVRVEGSKAEAKATVKAGETAAAIIPIAD